jgi:glycosyltransferase involved in cell wall biosynthesis
MKRILNEETIGIGIHIWNGQRTIEATLNSLINQKYKNIQIFILDNRSNDKTVAIIKKFRKKFKRIRLIIDRIKRDPASAQRILLLKYLKNYQHCMLIGDDDIFHKNYITNVFSKLNEEQAKLSYSSFKLIDFNNKLWSVKNSPIYNSEKVNKFSFLNYYFLNLIKFIMYRNLVPIAFGIFNTQALIKSFKHYKVYDESLVNFDNLMLVDFLATNKVSYTKEVLFYYRKKDRIQSAIIRKQKGIYQFKNISTALFLIFKYQLTFSIKVLNIIQKSKRINFMQKLILYLLILITYFQKCLFFITKKIFLIKFQYN